jgi:hypothetical protein
LYIDREGERERESIWGKGGKKEKGVKGRGAGWLGAKAVCS